MKFDKVITKKLEKTIVANNKEEEDIKNFFESVVDNNHFLLNQPMPLSKILKKILFCLPDIFRAYIPLLLKSFSDLADKKNIPESSNILPNNNITDQPGAYLSHIKNME